jgi:ribonuclease R
MQKFSNTVRGVLTVTMKGFGFVDIKDSDKDVFVAKDNLHGAVDGDTVTIRYKELPRTADARHYSHQQGYQKNRGKPEAEVIRVEAHNTEVLTLDGIIKTYNLNSEFPQSVIDESKKVAVIPKESELNDRIDLRKRQIITIDPFDAKDLDDAVSLEANNDGTMTLGVHIADVSHYVKENSELDKEAFKRGTSVYFPDRVIPMLPPQLSNNICSLEANEPRLTLSVFMTLDKNYNILQHKIAKTIIQTVQRFNYDEVQDILDGKIQSPHGAMLNEMAKITVNYERRRGARGEVAFNVPEPKILLDEQGGIKSVYAQPHKLSHRIIETFMILANEVVAEHFFNLDLPMVYRVHEKPDPIKVLRFTKVLTPFMVRHSLDPENATGQQYQNMLDNIKDENVKIIVSTLALRSMQKAKYSPDCTGHFGLGANYYCHFTSPIRRYPDLAIHRIIKLYLDKKLNAERIEQLKGFVASASEQSSKTEIDSMEAEREADNMKRAEFMHKHIGDTYDGVVSGIAEFGVFVYLPENTAEGLVRIENLPADENYKYNDDTMRMIGRHKKIRMGDKMTVTVIAVNLRKAKIEFTVAL